MSGDSVELTLRDGTAVQIRPIRPGDRGALERGFQRLSERSRYTRFLAPMERLSTSMLTYLTDVDHHDHEALIAIDPDSGDVIGVARYVRTDGTAAEAAVTVADQWQGDGLGTGLTSLLAERGLEEGIDRFTALLLTENKDMIGLLESLGQVKIIRQGAGTMEVEVPLEPERPGAGKGLYALLRAARRVAAAARAAVE
ncbi:MAG TPA: GNAT family N-acetyltransferase [Solirubrobacterales bacterium]|nr:GNAT family N-acetyltransferase [Solirubrobacterales bacterium]